MCILQSSNIHYPSTKMSKHPILEIFHVFSRDFPKHDVKLMKKWWKYMKNSSIFQIMKQNPNKNHGLLLLLIIQEFLSRVFVNFACFSLFYTAIPWIKYGYFIPVKWFGQIFSAFEYNLCVCCFVLIIFRKQNFLADSKHIVS